MLHTSSLVVITIALNVASTLTAPVDRRIETSRLLARTPVELNSESSSDSSPWGQLPSDRSLKPVSTDLELGTSSSQGPKPPSASYPDPSLKSVCTDLQLGLPSSRGPTGKQPPLLPADLTPPCPTSPPSIRLDQIQQRYLRKVNDIVDKERMACARNIRAVQHGPNPHGLTPDRRLKDALATNSQQIKATHALILHMLEVGQKTMPDVVTRGLKKEVLAAAFRLNQPLPPGDLPPHQPAVGHAHPAELPAEQGGGQDRGKGKADDGSSKRMRPYPAVQPQTSPPNHFLTLGMHGQGASVPQQPVYPSHPLPRQPTVSGVRPGGPSAEQGGGQDQGKRKADDEHSSSKRM